MLFSPSKSHRWIKCTGSVALESTLPDKPPSVYAIDGIFAHAVADYALKKRIQPSKLEKRLLGRKLNYDIRTGQKVEQATRVITKDIVDCIAVYIKYIWKKTKFEGVHSETEFVINKHITGTCDCHFVINGILYVIDYKHGAGKAVEVKDNPQLLLYAIGAYQQYKGIKKIKIIVIQPRNGGIKKWNVKPKLLEKWRKRFDKYCDKAINKPKLITGRHCQWCKAETRCIAKYFEYEEIENESVREQLISSGEYLNVLNNIESIRGFLNAIEKEAYHYLNSGHKLAGWKLVNKRETTKFAKSEKVIINALKKKGYKKKDLVRQGLKTLTDLRKIVNAEHLNRFLTKESSGLTMVRDTDKRPSVTDAQLDFKD